jgi:hypothetical protein
LRKLKKSFRINLLKNSMSHTHSFLRIFLLAAITFVGLSSYVFIKSNAATPPITPSVSSGIVEYTQPAIISSSSSVSSSSSITPKAVVKEVKAISSTPAKLSKPIETKSSSAAPLEEIGSDHGKYEDMIGAYNF